MVAMRRGLRSIGVDSRTIGYMWQRYVTDMDIAGPDKGEEANTPSCPRATKATFPTATSSSGRSTR
ncbi:hypothetical protein GCM10009838_21650 [Catenulispora subtropica]|uniref:Uncharacterized protein n=1 Tax=Catenulispora subtropica TaxID=450798 RepID=A0ABN2R636_9ACTN